MSSKNNPSGSSSFPDILSSLRKSCQSLEKFNNNLQSSTRVIELHTQDIPRINQVLKSSQFFELVSVSEIRTAQYHLTSELEPQLKELVKLSENGILKLQKREQMLRDNISKRKEASPNENRKSSSKRATTTTTTTEEVTDNDDDKDENLTKEYEFTLENLRSKKNVLLRELGRLDQELVKKKSLLKSLN